MGMIWLVAIPLVLIPFGLIVMDSEKIDEVAQAQEQVVANANKKIQQFSYGETIEFDLDPLPPTQEFVWIDKVVQVPKVIVDEDGNEQVFLVNETHKEQVPTKESTIYAEIQDRQTGDTKVCKIGHQCDIYGSINLYEPNSGLKLEPIMFHYIITCEKSEHPVLNCDNFIEPSNTILSYPDSTFKITFTTNDNVPYGDYQLFVRATSKYLDGFNQPIERETSLDIKVIQ